VSTVIWTSQRFDDFTKSTTSLNVSGVSPSFPTMKVPFTVTPVFWMRSIFSRNPVELLQLQLRASMPSRTAPSPTRSRFSTWRQRCRRAPGARPRSVGDRDVGLREPLEVQGLHGLEELARPAAPHERVVVGELDERVLQYLRISWISSMTCWTGFTR